MPSTNFRRFLWPAAVAVVLACLTPLALAMVPGPIEEDDIPPQPEPEPNFAPQPEYQAPKVIRLTNYASYPEQFYARCLSIGLPNHGALWGGVLFPRETPYYVADRPNEQWAAPEVVDALLYAGRAVQERFGLSHKVLLGDLSYRTGGKISRHSSHQSGRDADVGFFYRDGHSGFFKDTSLENIDLRRSWAYIESLVELNLVQYIFLDYSVQALFYNFVKNVLHYPNDYLDRVFQYPYGMGHNSGIIRHARGHRNHLHLRFYSPLAVANARQQRFDNPQMAELQDLMIQYETRLTAMPASFAPARGERAYLGTGGKRLIHTVRTGDTLWSIAKQYGATVSQIRAWNHMSSKDRLRVGQKLNVFQQKPKTDDQTG